MSACGPLATAPAAAARPVALLYIAGVASLSPLGLNAAVGLQPVFTGSGAMDASGRAAAVALFALGLGLGQPAAGDAADRWGRRPALLAGLFLALAGALVAAGATTSSALLLGRFMMGLGLATCLVVPRAVLRDMHHGHDLQRSMAVLSMVFAIAPAITPPIAWLLAQLFSWRAPMIMVSVATFACIVLAWHAHGETRPAHTQVPKLSGWLALARSGTVQRTTVTFSGAAAPFFIVAASGPQAIMDSTGASMGGVAMVLGASYLGFGLGNQWMRRCAATPSRIHMNLGVAVAVAGVALIATTLAWSSLWLWMASLTIYAIGHGVVFPAALALVLESKPQQAGLTTAAVGTVHMSTGALAGWVAGVLPMPAHQAVVLVTVCAAGVAVVAWYLIPFRKDCS